MELGLSTAKDGGNLKELGDRVGEEPGMMCRWNGTKEAHEGLSIR